MPLALLSQENPLTAYIKQYQLELYERFCQVYTQKEDFKLTKFGDYCGVINENTYIIFSENLVAYIALINEVWKGFCYRPGISSYIGNFFDMKSDGKGRSLFQ